MAKTPAKTATPKTATPKTATAKTAAPKAATPKKPAAKQPAAKKTAAAANGATKARFSKAIDDARASAAAIGAEAQAKAGAYRDQLAARSGDWVEEAKDLAAQAKDRATVLAKDGKTKTSDAIASLGKIVAENAGTIDEKLGARYGDYVRSAARSMQETAAKIESKDLAELGEDAKQFVRKSPGMAIGLAAVAGFLVSRLFKGGSSEE
ncbi:MAG: hypothetical protein RLZZ84_1985 [Pseudomonadota bacterium]|jgi:ElaB/YqjD/DUF883 family membrane-anchored ribosome-binding protein